MLTFIFISAEGYNVNIPWNKDKMSNSEYKAALDDIVLPITKQYQPELVIIAAGFDAAAADIIGEYVLTPSMYGYMTEGLKTVAPTSKFVLALEGGYNSKSIYESLYCCMDVLLGGKADSIEFHDPCKRAQQTISAVVKEQSRFWKLTR